VQSMVALDVDGSRINSTSTIRGKGKGQEGASPSQ